MTYYVGLIMNKVTKLGVSPSVSTEYGLTEGDTPNYEHK